MNKTKRLLVILPFIALLFGCDKKAKNNSNTTKPVVTNTNNKTNSKSSTKKNNNGLLHYEFVDYDGTILLENDVTKGTTLSTSIIPMPDRPVEGEYFYYFTGWSPSLNRTINSDVTYTAQYEKIKIPYEARSNKVYFGYYPQSQVTDDSIITNLNTLALTPSTNNEWVSYEYYSDNSTEDYMYFIDLDTNNDSRSDYRGVYFTNYRPKKTTYMANESNSNIDDYSYLKETIYWFKYEKIEWDILKNSDGSMLLMSNLVLDSKEFYPDHNNAPFEHGGSEGYVNSYKLSEIRRWLNIEFYNIAFNITEKKVMNLSSFSTREHTQSSSPVTSSCKDYVYLLSDEEINDFIQTPSNRITSATSYAKIQGISEATGNVNYWLRTPSDGPNTLSSTAISSQYVSTDGNIYYMGTDYTDVGVRPCILVKA